MPPVINKSDLNSGNPESNSSRADGPHLLSQPTHDAKYVNLNISSLSK
ncbi:MAG TPA: hypothetical protein PLP35_07940 [Caldisericia bacterium]|nr:hypothetical protein [Caldisericia bacterium]HRV75381.1 hypothetical protein [Caldisericia bacterium]